MTNTINGRTPEKIKRGLECCKPVWVDNHWKTCDTKCPYIDNVGGFCRAQLMADALAYIQQLERERDAAVADIRNAAWCCCHVCKHYYQPDPNVRIYSCKKHGDFDKHDFIADDGSIFCGAMEWRGVPKEE